MSPLKRKKLNKIRSELDKLDNSLIKVIKKRTNLVKKVLELKDKKNIELLKKVHFLLKDQGMTINGVKKILNNKESLDLDEISNNSIRSQKVKDKIIKISKIIKNLKDNK